MELIQFPPDFENNFLDTIGNETEHPLISDMWRIMNDFDYSGNVLYIASQAGILYREYDPSDINISKDMSMALDIYPNILVYGMQEITITSWIGVDINTIQIMDITGSIIYQDDGPIGYTEGIRLYSIPNLSSGKYFILFNTDKGNFISPIILIN